MMNNLRQESIRLQIILALLFVSLTAVVAPVVAQEPQLAAEKRAQLEKAISKFMATSHVPGVSVAVVENGTTVWSDGFGFADLENNVPATSLTMYRLASVSKSLTATAAMQLREQGKLDLEAPVQKYCPAFPQKDWPITTRQVLSHLGGIRHYRSNVQDDPETGNAKHFDDPIQAGLKFFADDPLVAKPGTAFHYSTQGYTLVGCVIEGASGKKYVDYVREAILVPAGMLSTQTDDRFAIIPYRTRFYHQTDSGVVQNADWLDASYKVPGGGWLSSVEDLARFEIAILNDTLMHSATRDAMWTIQKPSDGSPSSYALGWNVKSGTPTLVGHDGGQQGTSTAIRLAPEKRTGVVVLTNMDGVDAGGLSEELLKIMLEAR